MHVLSCSVGGAHGGQEATPVTRNPDLLVIGAGTAGNTCARTLARAGRSVVLVERHRVGGTCLWTGCMPKKALYNAAAARRLALRADEFGIVAEPVTTDWDSVLAWKWHAQETYAGDQETIAADAGIELLKGEAVFLSERSVAVEDQVFEPGYVLVATGSVPRRLSIPGGDLLDTSTEALSYPACPSSIAFVGSGFIAMEFAGIFASFGTKVTVLMRGAQPLTAFDTDIVDVARQCLEALGVTFVPNVAVTSVEGQEGALTLHIDDHTGRTSTLEVERAVAAIGRTPAVADLGLEAAGIRTDTSGRPVLDEDLRSTNPRVFFAGDASGGPQFTPVASVQGAQVAAALLGAPPSPPDPRLIPAAVFTVPQIGSVGLTEAQAQAAGIRFTVRKAGFDYVGAAIIADERQGFSKLLVDGDDRIIGAHVVGPQAAELAYACSIAMRSGLTALEMAAARAVHPSFSEAVNWSAWQ